MPSSPDLVARINHPKVKAGKWESEYQLGNFVPLDQTSTPYTREINDLLSRTLNQKYDSTFEATSSNQFTNTEYSFPGTTHNFVISSEQLPAFRSGMFLQTHHVKFRELFDWRLAGFIDRNSLDPLRRSAELLIHDPFPFMTELQALVADDQDKRLPIVIKDIQIEPFLLFEAKNGKMVAEDPQRAIVQVNTLDAALFMQDRIQKRRQQWINDRTSTMNEVTALQSKLADIDSIYLRAQRSYEEIAQRINIKI